jgi:hypothetical protein
MTPQEQRLKTRFEEMGIQLSINYTPLVQYTLSYSSISVSSPQFDQALLRFISELIKLGSLEDAS